MRYEKIKQIIDEWDPIGLLVHAPIDEYSQECQKIAERISETCSLELAGKVIYEVFSESFGNDTFDKNMYECTVSYTHLTLPTIYSV